MAEGRGSYSSEGLTEAEDKSECLLSPPTDLEEADLQLRRCPLTDKSITTCAQVKDFPAYYFSKVYETEKTSHQKPTEVHNVHMISFHALDRAHKDRIIEGEGSELDDGNEEEQAEIGKWLVFRHFDELDETWEKIRTAIERNELQSCHHASCSTMRYNPSISGPGPDTAGVICVFTRERDMDSIGFKLVELVQHDIKYKTDQDTADFKYSFTVSGPVSTKTIFWNYNGRPSFHCEDEPCPATSFKREDVWRLNVVEAPESLNLGEVSGRWVLFPEYEELTWLWHFLKERVESAEKNFGVIRMVCPPKQNRKSTTERPQLHFYTNRGSKKKVGMELIKIVERDIVYEHKPQEFQRRSSAPTQERRTSAHQYNSDQHYRGPVQERRASAHQYNSDHQYQGPKQERPYYLRPQEDRAPGHEVLFWNDGEPDYEQVRRKGITRNWRTGDPVT